MAKRDQQATEDKQSHKYFEDQLEGENVLYVFRKHPIVMRTGLVVGMLAWLIGPAFTMVLLLTHKDNPPSTSFFFISLGLSIILGLIILFPSWISWYFSVFIVTDQRFIQITQKRLFHRAVADIGLAQIQAINYEVSGLQETMLGFGTIKMQTYVGDLIIHDLHHPAQIQKKLLSILREEEITTNPYPAGSASNQSRTNEENEEAQADQETEES